jgi:uncharacterized membrane protein YhiD involved in acid resistance
MNEVLDQIFAATSPSHAADLQTIVIALLLSFVLGQLLAWIYTWTHSGLSYSRSYVQSLIILTMVAALVMVIIGANVIAAFGLIGALALIRFRNVLKDTRDASFIFCSLVVGMGVGSGQFGLSIIGTIGLCVVLVYLSVSGFGSRDRHDGMLRFRAGMAVAEDRLRKILRRHCRSTTLVMVRKPLPGGGPSEYAYQVTLRDRDRNAELIQELGSVEGLEDVSLALSEEMQEV